MKNKNGFTLIETMLSGFLLAFVLSGMLLLYVNFMTLGDLIRQITLASNAAQAQLESLKNMDFNNVVTDTDGFSVAGFPAGTARGAVEVVATEYADLKEVRITVSFVSKGGRIIGEDTNLDGQWQSSEDTNGNGFLDSPVEIITFVSR